MIGKIESIQEDFADKYTSRLIDTSKMEINYMIGLEKLEINLIDELAVASNKDAVNDDKGKDYIPDNNYDDVDDDVLTPPHTQKTATLPKVTAHTSDVKNEKKLPSRKDMPLKIIKPRKVINIPDSIFSTLCSGWEGEGFK